MTNVKIPPKDYSEAVDHPYDWIDPKAEYWATHHSRLTNAPILETPYNPDHSAIANAQAAYWATQNERLRHAEGYGKISNIRGEPERYTVDMADLWPLQHNPWVNGRYAVAAIVWGAIVMLVFSYCVGGAL